MIKVIRKDGSKRIVEIMKDRATDKYRFVNLTSMHICKCSFDTYTDALKDLYNDPFVRDFEVIKSEKSNSFILFLEKVSKIVLKIFR